MSIWYSLISVGLQRYGDENSLVESQYVKISVALHLIQKIAPTGRFGFHKLNRLKVIVCFNHGQRHISRVHPYSITVCFHCTYTQNTLTIAKHLTYLYSLDLVNAVFCHNYTSH